MQCPSCGEPASGKFCNECGTKLTLPCPSCGVPVTGKFCGECGTRVDAQAPNAAVAPQVSPNLAAAPQVSGHSAEAGPDDEVVVLGLLGAGRKRTEDEALDVLASLSENIMARASLVSQAQPSVDPGLLAAQEEAERLEREHQERDAMELWEREARRVERHAKALEKLECEALEDAESWSKAGTGSSKGAVVVVDLGGGTLKAGFVGELGPRVVVPSLVGKPQRGKQLPNDFYYGDAAEDKEDALDVVCPIAKRMVVNVEEMQKVWRALYFNELLVRPQDHPLLLTEASLTPRAQRDKLIQSLFFFFNMPGICVAKQPVLALYASGYQTGLLLDIGDDLMTSTPVYAGYEVLAALGSSDIGGRDLSAFMGRLIAERQPEFQQLPPKLRRRLQRDCKELHCYVAADILTENDRVHLSPASFERCLELPGRPESSMLISTERYRCPEALFRPRFAEKHCPSLHELAKASVDKCELDLRKEMLGSLVLSGGSSLFPGIALRLTQEMKNLKYPKPMRPWKQAIRVHAPAERALAVWIGGTRHVLNRAPFPKEPPTKAKPFPPEWCSKEEYNQRGPKVLLRKFF